jgi:hypothetical protein
MLSSGWSGLPGFDFILINCNYFDITTYQPGEQSFMRVNEFIQGWIAGNRRQIVWPYDPMEELADVLMGGFP